MGGKALKLVQTIRLEKDDYNILKNKIANLLASFIKIHFLYEVPDKTNFGDLDLLYELNENNMNIYDIVKQVFNPKQMVHNGNVLSFSYLINEVDNTYFQIDLIKTNNYIMDLFYFSYGDLGGIIGRITKYYGLTYGNNGLWITIEPSLIENYLKETQKYNKLEIGNINNKIILTQSPEEICNYLGFDYNKWKSGFKSNVELYNFIIESPYFENKLFYIETLNYKHRVRCNERPMYREFQNYINNITKPINNINTISDYNALVYFNKIDELESLIKKNIIHNERKSKFNGYLIKLAIQETFNKIIEDKILSEYIVNFKNNIKNKYNYDNFDDYIDNNSKEDIKNHIISYFSFIQSN